jgi:hypothetical protein
MPQLLDPTLPVKAPYNPQGEELQVLEHLRKRIPVLKDTKKNVLGGLDFEQLMKDADREYQPHSLRENMRRHSPGGSNSYILVQDEITGMRGSRIVRLDGSTGGQSWRSDISEPTLFTKVNTALSILFDQNPEAVFKAVTEKHKACTNIAHAMWKRSWELGRSRQQVKLFILDLAKYGWAIGRTYPRLVERDGEVLETLDPTDPSKNTYRKANIVEFNDVYREKLDPYRTWIDDMTNLTDPYSMDDWYFEKDYTRDTFMREFDDYDNSDKVQFNTKQVESEGGEVALNQRDDVITVGFYESKNKDLYAIYVPADDVVVYYSPLPNDRKKLSCWHTYWNERDPRTPYGVGIYELLKGNKVMYDRFENMKIDEMVLCLYPMLFYSGPGQTAGTGEFMITPGVVKQKLPGTTVEQVTIQRDNQGMEGVKFLSERMDENTGISPLLQGQVEGNTLGEVLHAKDAALKRLNIPLANIADALEVEAYIALSWMSQIYSQPEVQEFADEKELQAYMQETGKDPQYTGTNPQGKVVADFYPKLDLGLKSNREGVLEEDPENRFFQVNGSGDNGISADQLGWEGKVTIEVQSIIAPSQELERQRKLELFNLIMPVVMQIGQVMGSMPMMALTLAKPIVQILEIQSEKPENWLPDQLVEMLNNPSKAMKMQADIAAQQKAADPTQQLFVNPNDPNYQAAQEAKAKGQAAGGPQGGGFPAPQTPQDAAQSVVPQGEVANPLRASLGQIDKAPAVMP